MCGGLKSSLGCQLSTTWGQTGGVWVCGGGGHFCVNYYVGSNWRYMGVLGLKSSLLRQLQSMWGQTGVCMGVWGRSSLVGVKVITCGGVKVVTCVNFQLHGVKLEVYGVCGG